MENVGSNQPSGENMNRDQENVKVCVDCKYHSTSRNINYDHIYHWCSHPRTTADLRVFDNVRGEDFVNPEPSHTICEYVRNHGPCWSEGQLWEKAPPKVSFWSRIFAKDL